MLTNLVFIIMGRGKYYYHSYFIVFFFKRGDREVRKFAKLVDGTADM